MQHQAPFGDEDFIEFLSSVFCLGEVGGAGGEDWSVTHGAKRGDSKLFFLSRWETVSELE